MLLRVSQLQSSQGRPVPSAGWVEALLACCHLDKKEERLSWLLVSVHVCLALLLWACGLAECYGKRAWQRKLMTSWRPRRRGERKGGKVRESLNIALKTASNGLFSSVLPSPSSFHSLLTMRPTGVWDFWGL